LGRGLALGVARAGHAHHVLALGEDGLVERVAALHDVGHHLGAHRPETRHLAGLAVNYIAPQQRRVVDAHHDLVARGPATRPRGQLHQGVKGVGLGGLAPSLLPGRGEGLFGQRSQGGHDPGPVFGQAPAVQLPGAKGVGPLPQAAGGAHVAPALVQVTGPRVGLRRPRDQVGLVYCSPGQAGGD